MAEVAALNTKPEEAGCKTRFCAIAYDAASPSRANRRSFIYRGPPTEMTPGTSVTDGGIAGVLDALLFPPRSVPAAIPPPAPAASRIHKALWDFGLSDASSL